MFRMKEFAMTASKSVYEYTGGMTSCLDTNLFINFLSILIPIILINSNNTHYCSIHIFTAPCIIIRIC